MFRRFLLSVFALLFACALPASAAFAVSKDTTEEDTAITSPDTGAHAECAVAGLVTFSLAGAACFAYARQTRKQQ